MTKTSEPVPSPNHRSASGIRAIVGSGLNIDVSVCSISPPSRVVTASVVRMSAMAAPRAMPVSSTLSDCRAYPGISPLASDRPKAASTVDAAGKRSGLT